METDKRLNFWTISQSIPELTFYNGKLHGARQGDIRYIGEKITIHMDGGKIVDGKKVCSYWIFVKQEKCRLNYTHTLTHQTHTHTTPLLGTL